MARRSMLRSAGSTKQQAHAPSPSSTSSSSSSSALLEPHTGGSAPPSAEHTDRPRPHRTPSGSRGSGRRPSTATPSHSRSPTHRRTSRLETQLREDYLESADRRFAYMRLSGAGQREGRTSASAMDCYVYPRYSGDFQHTRTPSPLPSGRKSEDKSAATLSPIRGRTAEEAMGNYLHDPSHRRSSLGSRRNSPRRHARTPSLTPTNVSTSFTANTVTTVDPTEFSMEVYRQLHQRHFKTTSEELSFLRRDFVSSRKTLAVLHDDTVRLKAELQGRVEEIVELQEKIEWYRRQLDRLRGNAVTHQNASYERALHVAGGQRLSSAQLGLSEGTEDIAVEDDRGDGEDGSAVDARTTSPIALFAAADAARKKHRRNATGKKDGVDNEINTVELINELRRNLAKRDTALDKCNMEVAEVKRARDALERECRQAKLEASQARQEQQKTLIQLNEKLDALRDKEDALGATQKLVAEKDTELATLRHQKEIAELLGDFPAAKGVDAGLTQHEYLFDQVKTYRERWQAAEDRVDELSRKLLSLSPQDPTPAVAPEQATSSARPSEAELQRMETELRDQSETIRRLQRKMEREQESAAFREEQARQQRQEDMRQHALEVSALREQLTAARNQLLGEAKDRESLTRQLRQATHTETMVDTLQSQNSTLKQRVAALTAELAQVHGQEKELQVTVQREMGERMRLSRENEALYTQQKELERKATVLQETIEDLRKQLGAAEARCFSLAQYFPAHAQVGGGQPSEAGSAPSPSMSPSSRTGDAASMASELKGYAALMSLNANLQEKITRMEEELRRLAAATSPSTKKDEVSTRSDRSSTPQESEDDDVLGRQRAHLVIEVAELREELRKARKSQASLFSKWQALQREHQEVVEDNILLANGAEQMHVELQEARATRRRAKHERSRGQPQVKDRTGGTGDAVSSSRLRQELQRARQYAEASKPHSSANSHQEPERTCSARHILESSNAEPSYATQLKHALEAARRQVRILTSALASLPATPLKRCSPYVDCSLSPDRGSPDSVEAVAAQHAQKKSSQASRALFEQTKADTSHAHPGGEVVVTVTHHSEPCPCTPSGHTERAPAENDRARHSVTREEFQAHGTRIDGELAALRQALAQAKEERDHWRSLADRYTVVCTSTIDL